MKVRDLIKELERYGQDMEVEMKEHGEKFPYPVWCVETEIQRIVGTDRTKKVVVIVGLDE